MTARPAWLDVASSEVAADMGLWLPELRHLITWGATPAEACRQVGLSMSKVEKDLRDTGAAPDVHGVVMRARDRARKQPAGVTR
jgi:hypothetical protein